MAKPIKQKKGQSVRWVSKEDKNGWSLGLIVGKSKKIVWLHNFRFASREELQTALREVSIGYVPLKVKEVKQ
jgi:hypothetical protein